MSINSCVFMGIWWEQFFELEKLNLYDIIRAKNECTIKYDSYNISYDKVSKMWEVFYKKDVLGGDQSIYITDKGITTLIIYGE